MNTQEEIREPESHESVLLFARNAAQFELAEELHEDPIAWINTYSSSFSKIIEENPDLLERLANEDLDVHKEAVKRIKESLYSKEIQEQLLH